MYQNVGRDTLPTACNQDIRSRKGAHNATTPSRSFLTSLLILGLTCPGYAEQNNPPVSHGIVLTIVARDPKTHTATLRADEGGKEFQIPNSAFWKIDSKMLCDVVTGALEARSSRIVSGGKGLLSTPLMRRTA